MQVQLLRAPATYHVRCSVGVGDGVWSPQAPHHHLTTAHTNTVQRASQLPLSTPSHPRTATACSVQSTTLRPAALPRATRREIYQSSTSAAKISRACRCCVRWRLPSLFSFNPFRTLIVSDSFIHSFSFIFIHFHSFSFIFIHFHSFSFHLFVHSSIFIHSCIHAFIYSVSSLTSILFPPVFSSSSSPFAIHF